ncbi:uncharacterized protein B0T15DRAFT_531204 [Chaetomium strumarium]|uniref:C2H2-type domain-containing protein n=1 Tax=Chaetomium strumarium TaxID=1170767 RepID=A0AAJ0M153_9PEZI|nr:hypothetical protein B0T15DRAFT_531204 [Chaetomium strumarium]
MKDRGETNSVVAPSPPSHVRLSNEHSNDPRSPYTVEMLEDGNRNHIGLVSSAEQDLSTQNARRPSDESGTRITAPSRAHAPDWPTRFQAHAPTSLPSPGALLTGVGRERCSERHLASGTSLPSFDSLSQAPLQPFGGPLPKINLPRLLPKTNGYDHNSKSNLAGRDGLYSCPVCGRGFNRVVIMERHLRVHGIRPPPPREGEGRLAVV